jgi:LPXTG-site transpeptidase (sortase) family protein
MRPRWRIAVGAIGLFLVALSTLPLIYPSILAQRAPASVRRIANLPQPRTIISPENFPPPLPMANLQLSKEAPVSPDGWRIRMPRLGIDLPIVQGDGSSVPYFRAAHYPTTAWPGTGNRSFLYAHDQYGPPVMFGPLGAADRTGTDVYVDRPGQPELHYVIRQYYPAVPYTDLSWLQPTNHEELVLTTCTSWNATDPRVIAVAEPIQ